MQLPKHQILQLIDEGYSSRQIAKQLNLTTRQVTCFKYNNNITTSKFDRLELTQIEEEVIIGSLLGDGCIDNFNKKYNYNRFVVHHSIKQKDYLLYKYDLLSRISYAPVVFDRYDSRFKVPTYQMAEIKSLVNPLFTDLRNKWYPMRTKIVPEYITTLSPLSISIWYMDDGYKSNNQYAICTNAFDRVYTEKLTGILLNQYNIKTSIWKSGEINILSKDIFIDLISPYIIPSMNYKIKRPSKTNLKLGTPAEDNQLPTIQIS